jgi:FtsZ-interacting cell division protein ZipA
LISIGGVLIVGGIILLIVLILRKKRKNKKKRKNEQQLNENHSMTQQEKRETVVIESEMNTITSFDETNTNTTTFSTYQPGIHSSQINKSTNTFSLLHKHLIFDYTHIHTHFVTQEQKH